MIKSGKWYDGVEWGTGMEKTGNRREKYFRNPSNLGIDLSLLTPSRYPTFQ
jgi:hypothetical protein